MRYAVLVGLALPFAGCDDNIWGQSDDFETTAPVASGYAGVQEIAQQSCTSCHSPPDIQGGLDLETDLHLAIVETIGGYGLILVASGDPENSFFYQKMTGTHPDNTGTDMPPGSGGVGEAAAQVVYDWIADGATTE